MPQLVWDLGTAYDLFVSLDVLHYPAKYGVPGAWTAGMRARLPAPDRDILEQSQPLINVPLHWIYTLPEPKDGAALLWTLGHVSPAKRLPLLALAPDSTPPHIVEILMSAAARGAWDDSDREIVCAFYRSQYGDTRLLPPPAELNQILNWWTRVEEFGTLYLKALRTYYRAFFAEEEPRIRPALEQALKRGQELATRLQLSDLLEELSQGLRFVQPIQSGEMVLAPSYWSTPLVFRSKASPDCVIWLYGARTPSSSLVPGEVVPDTMLRALEALSDATRLRILQYLSIERLAPAELARRLRLRTPTVMHHLRTLRLAGFVQLTVDERKDQRTYAARPEALNSIIASLQAFLAKGVPDNPPPVAVGQPLHEDEAIGHS